MNENSILEKIYILNQLKPELLGKWIFILQNKVPPPPPKEKKINQIFDLIVENLFMTHNLGRHYDKKRTSSPI